MHNSGTVIDLMFYHSDHATSWLSMHLNSSGVGVVDNFFAIGKDLTVDHWNGQATAFLSPYIKQP